MGLLPLLLLLITCANHASFLDDNGDLDFEAALGTFIPFHRFVNLENHDLAQVVEPAQRRDLEHAQKRDKTENLLKQATLKRNNLITTLAEIPLEYSISFELYPNSFQARQWRSILHFTIHGNNNRPGYRTPGIWANGYKRGAIHICSNVNGQVNRCVDSKPIGLKRWNRIKVSQRRNENGEYVYQAEVNENIELKEINNMPQLFKNVKVYAADPWYFAQDGFIRNLDIKTDYESEVLKQNENLVKQATLKRNNLITTLAEIPLEYSLSFELYLNSFQDRQWRNILHFTIQGNYGRPGYRTPALWAHGWKRGSLHICSNVNEKHNRCVDSKPLPIKQWSSVKISQRRNENGEYIYKVEVNGVVELEEVNKMPQLFKNVKVYAANPFNYAQDGIIKDLILKTDFVEKKPEVNFKSENLVKQATLKRNNLITTLAEIPLEYSLSFELYLNSFQDRQWRNILHFTIQGNYGRPGYRTPALWAHGWKRGSLHICSNVNEKHSRCVDSKPLPIKQWSSVKISQRRNENGEYIYKVEVNGVVELEEVNKMPQLFKNVKVYAANPFNYAQDGIIKDLILKTGFVEKKPEVNFQSENLLKQATLKRNNLITTLAEIPLEYSLSFELYLNSFRDRQWRSILHFTIQGNYGRPGYTTPALWAHGWKRGSLRICSNVNEKPSRCVDSKPLPIKQWSSVKISQRRNENGEYIYKVEVNGVVELEEVNKMPQLFKNVKVYAANPFHYAQDGIIKDLILKTDFDEKKPGEGETEGSDQENGESVKVAPEKPKTVEPQNIKVPDGHLPYNVEEIASSGTVEYKTGAQCVVVAKDNKDGGRVLEVDQKRCPGKLSLGFLLNRFFKHRGNIDELTSDFVQSANLRFLQMKFEKGFVDFKASSFVKSYKHTQTMIVLTQVYLSSLRIPVDNTVLTIQSIYFTLEGFNKLGKCFLHNKIGSKDTVIDITTKVIIIDEFIINWQLIMEDLVVPEINFNFNGFKGATAAAATIKGVYNADEGMQLVMSLGANDDGVFTEYSATVRFLIFKRPNKPIKAAMTVEYETNVIIRQQLKLFTDYEFSSPQFVKEQPRKWVLSSSMIDVKLIQNEDYLSVYGGTSERMIHKGANIYIRVDMQKALKKCDPDSPAPSGLPADGTVLVRMHLGLLGISTHLPSSLKVDVHAMLKCIQPGAVELPQFLFSLTNRLGLKVTELVVAPAAKKFILTVDFPKEIAIYAALKMVNAQISIVKEGGNPWTVVARSGITFGPKIKGNVKLSVDSTKELKFLIRIAFMSVDELFKALGKDVFSDSSLAKLKNVFNVGVKNFALSIAFKFGEMKNARIVVSGAPVITGLTSGDIKLVAMIYNPTEGERRSAVPLLPGISNSNLEMLTPEKRSGSRAVTFGFIYPYIRLDKIFNDIGFKIHTPWLGEASTVLLLSTARKVRCKDPKTGKTAICLKKKDVKDMKSKDEKDSSSSRGTERLKESEKKKIKEDDEGEDKSDEDREKNSEKELFTNIAEISDMVIAEGVTIRSMFRLPHDCQGDGICMWIKHHLGNNIALQINGRFTKTQMSLEALIHMKVVISDMAFMTGFRFEIKLGLTNSISLGLKFYLTKLDVVITADITLSAGKLELRGTMASMVMQPFGIKFLAIGDLLLGIGITFSGLPAFELGAQIWLGGFKDGKDTENTLKFQGYVGMDPSNPSENYFFFQSIGADLTLGNILKAFGSDIKLPKQVADSGLYNFVFSLNLGVKNKDIVEFGFSFPPGLKLEGKLNVLGYKIEFKLRFNHKAGSLYLKADFDPIDDWAGGLITLVRSPEERSKGPSLLIDVDPKASRFFVDIEGYVNVIGISVYIKIKVNDNGLEFTIKGNVWNVLRAQVTIKMNYGNGKLKDFSFRGCLAFEMDKIADAIRASLDHAKKEADKALQIAKAAVSWAKGQLQEFRKSISNMQDSIKSYQDRLRKRSAEIEEEKKALEYDCTGQCGESCVPFFGWKWNCWQGWWGEWHGCMTWEHCKWKVPNVFCIAGCEIGKGFKKLFLFLEQLGIKIMLGLTTIADKLLDGVKAISLLGDVALDMSNHLLEFANIAVKALIDLPATIAQGLGNLLSIHQFCIYGNFDPNDKSCIGMYFDVTLIGIRFQHDGSLCLGTNIYGKIGKTTAAKRIPEVDKIDDVTVEIKTKKRALEVKVKELEKEKEEQESEVNTETTKEYKRSLVPTAEELIIHEAAFGPIPNHDLRNARSVGAIQRPWEDQFDLNTYMEELQKKRSFINHPLPNEDNHDPCKVEETTLERYSNIVHVYQNVLKQTEETKQNYLKHKRSDLNHVNNINKQIQQGLSKYNMTMEEKADLAFWRDTVEQSYESYAKSAEEFLQKRKRDNINTARQDLDQMLLKERGIDLPQYLDHLQSLRSKRSNIEHDTLNKIHKQIYAVVTQDIPYREVARNIDYARNALLTTKKSSIPCAA